MKNLENYIRVTLWTILCLTEFPPGRSNGSLMARDRFLPPFLLLRHLFLFLLHHRYNHHHHYYHRHPSHRHHDARSRGTAELVAACRSLRANLSGSASDLKYDLSDSSMIGCHIIRPFRLSRMRKIGSDYKIVLEAGPKKNYKTFLGLQEKIFEFDKQNVIRRRNESASPSPQIHIYIFICESRHLGFYFYASDI